MANGIYWLRTILFISFVLFRPFITGNSLAGSAVNPGQPLHQTTNPVSKRMWAIIAIHEERVKELARSPIIIESVKEQNKQGKSLEEIRKIDLDWINGKKDGFAMELMTNRVGTFLYNKLSENKSIYVEAFLCDNQGAVVGEYPKTTDYWQGDEDKFIKSYNNGNGMVFIGPIEFDDSTKTISVQLSVPVVDNGKTIGVLIVGLKNIE